MGSNGLWFVLGLAPGIGALCLGMRSIRRNTPEAWDDFGHVSVLLGRLAPALALLAAAQFAASAASALLVFAALVFYDTVEYIFNQIRLRPARLEALSIRRYIGSWARSLIASTAVLILLLLLVLLSEGSYRFTTSLDFYVMVIAALWLGAIVSRIGWTWAAVTGGEMKLLAPCELASRIGGIARVMGVRVEAVRIMIDPRYTWLGGFALSRSEIALTDHLVNRLRKPEVDAVVAHELGHLTDRNHWWLHQPIMVVGWLAIIAVAALAEKGIAGLPVSWAWLNDVNWVLLFIVPPLLRLAYSRRQERAANHRVNVLNDPAAHITSFYKLALADRVGIDRPRWADILASHPSIGQTVRQIACERGIEQSKLQGLRSQALAELEAGNSDRYELVFHEQSEERLADRPDRAKYERKLTWAPLAVIALLFAALTFASQAKDGTQFAARILTCVCGIVVLIVVAWMLLRRAWLAEVRGFRNRLLQRLQSKYSSEQDGSEWLVDVILTGDWDDQKWQSGYLGFRENHMLLLAETSRTRIPAKEIYRLGVYSLSSSGSQAGVLIWYNEGNTSQWLVVRPFTVPSKEEPRSLRLLERTLRERIAASGGHLPAQSLRKHWRRCIKRASVAIVVLSASFGFVAAVDRLTSWNAAGVMYWIPFVLVLGPLISWVRGAVSDDGEVSGPYKNR